MSRSGSLSNLQGPTADPAFVSNERLRRASKSKQGTLNDCCYSICNVVLIVASVVAIVFTAKFFSDDPLYDVGDYLLTLRFYRQLIYVIVILPLILLIPLFNAISAFCLIPSTGAILNSNSNQINELRQRKSVEKSLLSIRIFYQILMLLLIFIALTFIGPNIKSSSVSNQIDIELRKYMYRRYENEFLYEFLDRIQTYYRCCDQTYYLNTFNDKLPLSCFHQDGFYNQVFPFTCSEVIGEMVSTRCIIITICFVVLIMALLFLIVMDISKTISLRGGKYWIEQLKPEVDLRTNGEEIERLQEQQTSFSNHQTALQDNKNLLGVQQSNASRRGKQRIRQLEDSSSNELDNLSSGNSDILAGGEAQNRSKSAERFGDVPLLPPKPRVKVGHDFEQVQQQPILTRANYLNQTRTRPQSPIFLGQLAGSRVREDLDENERCVFKSSLSPGKSALKKSTSSITSKLSDDTELDKNFELPNLRQTTADHDGADSEEDIQNYQRQLQRELQTRRSLLNVRFAE